ncbi:endonuclease III domain-containing protein [Thermococcus piezophilus]|uniref:Endonuclease III n=1 Tax=Thermococcus piezophilus TaxID=1712654 RepID=A0A172WEL6_9EURY|nr:endonuclease III [Thermococcus piezophilus]ANF21863.1 endonuclease III [Thermococcus piezophilus]
MASEKSGSLSLEGFTFSESWEKKRKRAKKIVEILTKTHPREKLLIGDPYRTLIHCIISQRMRDEVTYNVWEELFKRYGDIETIATTPVEEMQKFLRKSGVGLWKTKGEWIVKASQIILERYGGKVPDSLDELMKLPGIGRKCANIVLAYGLGRQAIPVDTHVNRISKRLGLAPPRVQPERVEDYLRELIPREKWIYVNHAMVDHGRAICKPVKPKCESCPLRELCPYAKGLVTDEDIKGNSKKGGK